MRKKRCYGLLIVTMAILLGCLGCDEQKWAQQMQEYETEVKRLENQYGDQLTDPNFLATTAGQVIQRRVAAELTKLDQKYSHLLIDPNGPVQRGVQGVQFYTPAAEGVAAVLPTPYREIALAGLGIVTTLTTALSRRRWKTTTEELLYSRSRLQQRIEASDIETKAFEKERDTAEGEALNPPTLRLIKKAS